MAHLPVLKPVQCWRRKPNCVLKSCVQVQLSHGGQPTFLNLTGTLSYSMFLYWGRPRLWHAWKIVLKWLWSWVQCGDLCFYHEALYHTQLAISFSPPLSFNPAFPLWWSGHTRALAHVWVRGHLWVVGLVSHLLWDSISHRSSLLCAQGWQACRIPRILLLLPPPVSQGSARDADTWALLSAFIWILEGLNSGSYTLTAIALSIEQSPQPLPYVFICLTERERSQLSLEIIFLAVLANTHRDCLCPWFGGFKEHGSKDWWLICIHHYNLILCQTHEITQVV